MHACEDTWSSNSYPTYPFEQREIGLPSPPSVVASSGRAEDDLMPHIVEGELEVLRAAIETGLAIPWLQELARELRAGTLKPGDLSTVVKDGQEEETRREICLSVETILRLDREARRAMEVLASSQPLRQEIKAVLLQEVRHRREESLRLLRGLGLHRKQLHRLIDRIAELLGQVTEAEQILTQCGQVLGMSPEELLEMIEGGRTPNDGRAAPSLGAASVMSRRTERALKQLREVQELSGLRVGELRRVGGRILWIARRLRRSMSSLCQEPLGQFDHQGKQPPR